MNRKSFLKLSGVAAAGSLFIPKMVMSFGSDSLSVYVPDVEGIKYNNSLVEVFDDFGNSLGSGTTIDSLASFLITGVEENNAIKTKANVDFNSITKELKYTLDGSSRVIIKLSDILGRQKTLYNGRATLNNGYCDSRRHNEIMEECTSLLFGYNGVNNLDVGGKTVLNRGGNIHPMDTKLIKMLEYYKPLEKKENILG